MKKLILLLTFQIAFLSSDIHALNSFIAFDKNTKEMIKTNFIAGFAFLSSTILVTLINYKVKQIFNKWNKQDMFSLIKNNKFHYAGMNAGKKLIKKIAFMINNKKIMKKERLSLWKGILFYGAPGTGKSALIKYLRTLVSCPMINFDTSINALNGRITCEDIKSLFQQAQKNADEKGFCIIVIEEFGTFAKNRDSKKISYYERMLINEFLVCMDNSRNVLVIGTTNTAIENIDPAFLRSGRFDKVLQLKHPDVASRKQIIELAAKEYKIQMLESDITVLAELTEGLSPISILSIINDAYLALHQNIKEKKMQRPPFLDINYLKEALLEFTETSFIK